MDEIEQNPQYEPYLEKFKVVQDEWNTIRNQQLANAAIYNNRMWLTSTPFTPNDLVSKQGSITTAGTGYGSVVRWMDESFDKRQEQDVVRNLKLFAHFAKMFCERYPNWQIQPCAKDPFKKLIVVHNSGKYSIESNYPSNELKLHGKPAGYEEKRLASYSDTMVPITTPQEFFGWALGMDDVPDYIKE